MLEYIIIVSASDVTPLIKPVMKKSRPCTKCLVIEVDFNSSLAVLLSETGYLLTCSKDVGKPWNVLSVNRVTNKELFRSNTQYKSATDMIKNLERNAKILPFSSL